MAEKLKPEVQALWDALLSCEPEAVRSVLERERTKVKMLCETFVPSQLLWQDCTGNLNDKLTALHYVAMVGDREMLYEMIRRNGQINLNVTSAQFGWTPLHYAIQGGHVSAVQILVENGADQNKQDINGASPLHLAISSGFPEVAEYLLRKGTKVNIQDNKGETALHVCLGLLCSTIKHLAPKQRTKLAAMLIQAGSSVRMMNRNGDTPLHVALRYHGIEVCSLLMKAPGATDTLEVANDTGHIPLLIADDVTSLELLLLHGSDINFQGPDGRTALHMRIANPDMVNLLLDHKADVNILDNQGRTPLHVGLSDEGVPAECICHLLMSMLDVNIKDNTGNSPLHLACKMKIKASLLNTHDPIIDLLINQGAQVNLQNKKGQTPLHVALRYDHYVKARQLLQVGASPDIQDVTGLTPRTYDPRWIAKSLRRQASGSSQVEQADVPRPPDGVTSQEVVTDTDDDSVSSGPDPQTCSSPESGHYSPTPIGCVAPPNTATRRRSDLNPKDQGHAENPTSFVSSSHPNTQVVILRQQLAQLQGEVTEFKEMLEQCAGPSGDVQDEVDTVRTALEDVYEDR